MAWRNVWRNPRRTLVFMLSLQFGSYETMINTSVKIYAGHLQVQAEEYHEKMKMRMVVTDPDSVSRILDSVKGVEAYTARAKAFSLVSSDRRTSGVLVIGIDPEREANVSTIKRLIRDGRYLSSKDTNKAIVGKLLAKNLQVVPGDELTLLGQGRDGSIAATVLEIKGIFGSGIDEFDRSALQIPLKYFQEVFAMGNAVHEVVVIGESLNKISDIKSAVQMNLDGLSSKYRLKIMDWMELMPGLLQGIQIDLVGGIIFYVILILVVSFSILNTFLMAIFERTREFGMLMAIGTTPKRLTKLLLMESMCMTIIGVAMGIILGSIITFYFQVYGIDLAGASEVLKQYGISGRLHPRLTFISVTSGPLIVMFFAFCAALYPALKVRSLKPVEAMAYV
ncbi:MAG: ABC transporter permease [Deltaproteobacteria bacterium]|nr:ABC transporter permease [Deltaproteobacteria bacterium]